MDFLIVLAALALLAGPLLAIIALLAVRRLDPAFAQSRLQDLTARVEELEQQVKRLRAARERAEEKPTPTVPPREETAPAVARPAPPPPPAVVPLRFEAPPVSWPGLSPPIPPAERRAPVDLESLIAGKWFNRIGIVAILFAVSYFLKLAFDNDWIGRPGRVAIGILLGAAMLPWSHWLAGRGYSYFSEGIAALGEATLFVSVWAGCQY
ncbi:MAG TPA: DUF2339 domain-containing protein, partial [Candidatus Acidoferrum sp.]|nr:DUF2339 domain-containing protein [Candidatus Acidoferrum sp.]